MKQTQNTCTDKNCPIHGNVRVRGREFTGTVVSDRMSRTVVVAWTRRVFLPKYERYEMRSSRLNAHNPECMVAKKGDKVVIAETRPLSKTKHFTITKVLGRETKKESLKTEATEDAEVVEHKAKAHKEERELE